MLGLIILPEVMGRISDPMSGYFMVRRDVLCGTNLKPLGYKVLVEVMAREVAIANNFFGNDLWTFEDISSKQKGIQKKLRRFLKFNLICLSRLILNVLILNIFYKLLGINEYVANIMAIALVTFWNFRFNLKLNWQSNH